VIEDSQEGDLNFFVAIQNSQARGDLKLKNLPIHAPASLVRLIFWYVPDILSLLTFNISLTIFLGFPEEKCY
jgi:hypothetical protein